MVAINGKTTLALNGKTPVKIDGTEYYQWFDGWLDGLFFWTATAGSVLTIRMSSNLDMGMLRYSGQLAARISDTAKGERYLDAIIADNDVADIITLSSTISNTIMTFDGDDQVTIGANGGFDYLDLGNGNDVVTLNSRHWLGTVNLGQGNNRLTANDQGAGIEVIMAGQGNDRITVKAEVSTINAGRGNDTITTGAQWVGAIDAGRGKDKVTLGEGGADFVSLGRDADTLILKAQADPTHTIMVNGGGNVSSAADSDSDTISFAAFSKAVEIDLNSGRGISAQGRVQLREIENVTGGKGSDTIIGNWEDNVLSGGNGRDRLVAGEGADKLTGGAGADLFVFRDVDGKADRITDFKRAQKDKIDLRELDDDLDFIGNSQFSGDDGEIRFLRAGSQTQIQGDLDGDGKADFTIILNQSLTLVEKDFLL